MVEPTCTGYGYTEHACKHCDYHYTSDIRQPLGHKGELQLVKEASCTEDGYTGDTVCNVCNEVIQTGKLIPATGHSFGEWAVTQEADCFHDGLQVRACTVCGQEESRACGEEFRTLSLQSLLRSGLQQMVPRGR